MANITSAATGDFSDPATWVGGVVPGVGDVAIAAASHVITIDVDVTVDEVRSNNTSGYFVLGNGRTLNANVAGGATTTNNGTLVAEMTTSATINGNITPTQATDNTHVVRITGTGTLTINGTVNGGTGASNTKSRLGVSVITACALVVNGDVTGGQGSSNAAIRAAATASSSAQITLNGNVLNSPGRAIIANCVLVINGGILASITVASADVSVEVLDTSGFVTVNGDIIDRGLEVDTGAVAVVNGNVTGGSKGGSGNVGVRVTGNSTATINGTVTGGPSNSSFGAVGPSSSSGSLTINGNAVGGSLADGVSGGVYLNGDAVASETRNGVGGSTTRLFLNGNAIDHPKGRAGVAAGFVHLVDPSTFRQESYTYGGLDVLGNVLDGDLVTLVDADEVGYPAESDVRLGTDYAAGTFTGTLAVPQPEQVASGIATDDTVGTGTINQGDLVTIIGTQIAAATTAPTT